jgi:hypothetical protein
MAKSKKYKHKDGESSKIEQASTNYLIQGSALKVYHSFEEMNEGDAEYAASIHPIEGLRNTIELILLAYGVTREELETRVYSDKITVSYF